MKLRHCIEAWTKPPSIALAIGVALAAAAPTAGCWPDPFGPPEEPGGCPESEAYVFYATAFPADEEDDHLATFSGEVTALGEDTCTGRQQGYSLVMGDEMRARPGDSITVTVDDGSTCGTFHLYLDGLPFDVALGDALEVRAEQPRSMFSQPFEVSLRKNGELMAYMVDTSARVEDVDVPPEIEVRIGDVTCNVIGDSEIRNLRATRNGVSVEVPEGGSASLEGFTVINRWLNEYASDGYTVDGSPRDVSFAFVRE